MADYDNPRPSSQPVGSVDLAVAKDDLITLDLVVAGNAGDVVTNRKGKQLDTLAGAIDKLSWDFVGLFADGVTFTKPTDYAITAAGDQWIYTGSYPFTAPAGTVPTAPLYQTISARNHGGLSGRNPADGSAHNANDIGRGVSTVDADLTALEEFAERVEFNPSIAPCENIVFDMHRDAMKNQGAILGEQLTTNQWPVTAAGSKGDLTITTASNGFVVGQLIGYTGVDGEYYTSRVKTAGAIITLYDALEADIDASSIVFNFFKDKSHPSINGYRAIADYMLRQRVYQKITSDISSLTYTKVGGTEIIDTLASDDFLNCGSSEYPAVRMQTSNQNDGFIASNVQLSSGDASIELVINTNGSDIRLRVAMNDETASFIVDRIINTELPTKISIPIRKKLDAAMIIRMQQADAGSADINFIMNVLTGSVVKIDSLNGGRHVLHGDSWFFQEGIYQRLQERLPNATIINNGVGGRTSTNLAQTVYTEVEPLKPDYVWCIAGTNDGVLGASASDYHKWMNQLIVSLKDIGATPIMFTPACGNLIDGWLSRSRAYLYRYDFRDTQETLYSDMIVSFASVPIPATSDVFVASAGRTRDSVTVIEAFGNGVNNVNFGYSAGMSSPTTDVDTKTGNSIINGFTVAKSDNSELYFNVSCENTTGTQQTANGFVRLRIKSSRN